MKKKLFSILPLIALGSCATKVDVEPMVETPEIQQQIQEVQEIQHVQEIQEIGTRDTRDSTRDKTRDTRKCFASLWKTFVF